jgi:methylglutaconyl-CoA hydratase
MSTSIDISKGNGIATVTLNRADKHNAFDDSVIEQMTHALKDIDADDSVRVMILAANGKHFSAGADLAWMKRMATYSYDENLRDAHNLATMLKTLNFLSKPTIARVQGAAFGGAVGLVSCCDIAIATPSASFCLSEVKIGLIPATISPYVISAIGERAARRYFVTAERFDAEQALKLGLLSEIQEDDKLDTRIEELTEEIKRNSPKAVSAAKKLALDVSNVEIDNLLIEDTCVRIATIRASKDGQEGLSAFLEKRPPSWINYAKEKD